jgi:hypothetical protein
MFLCIPFQQFSDKILAVKADRIIKRGSCGCHTPDAPAVKRGIPAAGLLLLLLELS